MVGGLPEVGGCTFLISASIIRAGMIAVYCRSGKKDSISSIITPLPEVTVVKKVKKQKEEES